MRPSKTPGGRVLLLLLIAASVSAGGNLYSLFTNRSDPGTNRVEYQLFLQPIRNGDSGNIGLGFLGLPAIPGSFMIPRFVGPKLLVQRERTQPDVVKVIWSAQFQDFTLQSTASLKPPVVWQSLGGITQESGFFVYRVPSGSTSPKLFRLRTM